MTTRSGLASSEAARRLAEQGPNELLPERAAAPWRQLFAVLAEPMIALLAAVGGTYLALGDAEQGAVLLASIVVVIAITVVQTRRAERALAALRGLASPRALVVRDSREQRIAGREVVTGDLLVLNEGDRVAADADVVDARNLTVDESMLTGESVPAPKFAADERADADAPAAAAAAAAAAAGAGAAAASARVLAGTLVVGGHARAVVVATGARTVIGGIGRQVESPAARASPLQRETRQLVWIAAATGLLLSAGLAVLVARSPVGGGMLDGLLAGLTLAMALLPEEMPIVLSLFFAIGAWRISRRNVLTRYLPAIEALGSISVLCVDKTGTLTENRMRLECVASTAGATAPSSSIVEAALLASARDGFDPMDRALARQAAEHGVDAGAVYARHTLRREYPLLRERLAVTRAWQAVADDPADRSGLLTVATKGSPEAVATLCRLEPAQVARVLAEVDALAGSGLRVLGVARAAWPAADALPDDPRAYPFAWLGAVAFVDPLRADVADAMAACRSAGVRIVMITGDHATTARAIGERAGLGRDLKLVGGDRLAAAIVQDDFADTRIFCRVTPQQKLDIVEAFRARGDVVAMTGDGVNDAPALRRADVGIAMGERGTDVARESADLVLMDDSFASIAAAIHLGRRLYDNLRQAFTYLLAVHVPTAGVSLLPPMLGLPPLLWPVHIVLLEFIIDPACTLVFEAEQADDDVMTRPPRPRAQRLVSPRMLAAALGDGLIALAAVLLPAWFALAHGLPEGQARGLVFSGLVLTNLALLLAARSQRRTLWQTLAHRNRPFAIVSALALAAVAVMLYLPPASRLFGVAAPGVMPMLLVAASAVAALLGFDAVRRLAGRAPGLRPSGGTAQ